MLECPFCDEHIGLRLRAFAGNVRTFQRMATLARDLFRFLRRNRGILSLPMFPLDVKLPLLRFNVPLALALTTNFARHFFPALAKLCAQFCVFVFQFSFFFLKL